MIWYEPWVLFDSGIPTLMGKIKDRIDPPRIGFAFHNYIPYPQGIPFSEIYGWDNAIDHSKATGATLLSTEFGADIGTEDVPAATAHSSADEQHRWKDDAGDLLGVLEPDTLQDREAVLRRTRPLGADGDRLRHQPGVPRVPPPNVNEASLLALTRPYPMFIAGTPVSWSFDLDTRVFNLSYVPDLTIGSNITEIFVPDLQYPNGFKWSSTASETWQEPQALLVRTSDSSEMVEVSISPA